LRLVDGIDGFDALDLDHHEVFYNQIDAIAEFDLLTVIDDWQSHLLCDSKVLFAEFVCKVGFVRDLEQSRAKTRVNLHRGRNHSARNSVNARIRNDCRGGHSCAFIMLKTDSSVIFEHSTCYPPCKSLNHREHSETQREMPCSGLLLCSPVPSVVKWCAMADTKIRVLVAKPGLDGHDRGAKVIARALRDAGMEVIYTGLRQTPEMIVTAALQEDVQVIGLSILSGAHNAIVPRVMDLLKQNKMDDVIVIVGGIIPNQDIDGLKKIGVAAIFQPGTAMDDIVQFIRTHVKGPGVPAAG